MHKLSSNKSVFPTKINILALIEVESLVVVSPFFSGDRQSDRRKLLPAPRKKGLQQ